MTWTADQAGVLLGTIALADSRYAGMPEQERADLSAWWASRLNHHEVDPEYAMGCVSRHYDRETRKMTIADILIPWNRHRDAEDAKEAAQVRAMAATIPDAKIDALHINGQGAPEWFQKLMGDCGDEDLWRDLRKAQGRAWYAARDGQRATALMVPGHPYTEPAFQELIREERERDCHTPGCACPHTVCRGGFLDAETSTPTPHDRAHLSAGRCGFCWDAVTMRSELNPPKRKGKRR